MSSNWLLTLDSVSIFVCNPRGLSVCNSRGLGNTLDRCFAIRNVTTSCEIDVKFRIYRVDFVYCKYVVMDIV